MKLALGTVQFGLPYGIANSAGQVSLAAAGEIIRLARANGVDTVDTAIAYGDSERCLGTAGVAGLRVVSKLPALPEDIDDVEHWVRSQLAGSLSRLGIDALYGLLLHRPGQLTGPQGLALARALQAVRSEGLVRKIGVSIYAPDELAPALAACPIDLVQAPFSILDQRLRSSGWLARLKAADIEVHTRSAFLQGLLLLPRAAIPEKFAHWSALWDSWHGWLAEHGQEPTAACLAGVLAVPGIDRVVVGVDSAAQFAQLLASSASTAGIPPASLASDDPVLLNPALWNSLPSA